MITITDPCEAYYCAKTQEKRIPELEHIIMKDFEIMHWYAREVIKDRWPEAEPMIMKDPCWAHHYAQEIIKGRWPEAEQYIMKQQYWANRYLRWCSEARTPTKDIPLVLGDYALTDVPNTITDDQVKKLIKLIAPNAINAIKQHNITFFRSYYEPQIKQNLVKDKLNLITTKQLLNDEQIRTVFLKSIDCFFNNTDFV